MIELRPLTRQSLFSAIILIGLLLETAGAQTVQLPTTHTFSLDTTVMVPDQGGSYSGGIGRFSESSSSRGPLSASSNYGRSARQSNSQTKVSIIDLEELDRELAEQTVPTRRAWNGNATSHNTGVDTTLGNSKENADLQKAKDAVGKASIRTREPQINNRSELSIGERPSYDYLAILSHVPSAPEDSFMALEDASYYLEQARKAKDRRHWSTVEVYYLLAWKSLPPSRRQAAIAHWNKPKLESLEQTTKTPQATRK